jgi:hypothetical protein
MAKVASSSVTAALRQHESLNVFQIHLLSPDNIRWTRRHDRYRAPGARDDLDLVGTALYRGVIRKGGKAKIITLVREPIGRNIAAYFQRLDGFWQTERAHEKIPLDDLIEGFFAKYHHDWPLKWFDVEFKRVLGVDVYEHEFSRDAGHARIDSGCYQVLVMRHDLEDGLKARCLEELVPPIKVVLMPSNVGDEKPYAQVYREFLRAIKMPEAYVDRMLYSKYTRHFFGDEEIDRLRSKWMRRDGSCGSLD